MRRCRRWVHRIGAPAPIGVRVHNTRRYHAIGRNRRCVALDWKLLLQQALDWKLVSYPSPVHSLWWLSIVILHMYMCCAFAFSGLSDLSAGTSGEWCFLWHMDCLAACIRSRIYVARVCSWVGSNLSGVHVVVIYKKCRALQAGNWIFLFHLYILRDITQGDTRPTREWLESGRILELVMKRMKSGRVAYTPPPRTPPPMDMDDWVLFNHIFSRSTPVFTFHT